MTVNTVILGKISGVQGIKGWLKVFSYTRPPDSIFQYKSWLIQRDEKVISSRKVIDHAKQGKKLLVKFGDVIDRTGAEELVGMEVAVFQKDLPALTGEYYWRDLIGLTVNDTHGTKLGKIVDLMETGSNDVLLLEDCNGKSMAIPWLPEVIVEVNTGQSLLIVEWEGLV